MANTMLCSINIAAIESDAITNTKSNVFTGNVKITKGIHNE